MDKRKLKALYISIICVTAAILLFVLWEEHSIMTQSTLFEGQGTLKIRIVYTRMRIFVSLQML